MRHTKVTACLLAMLCLLAITAAKCGDTTPGSSVGTAVIVGDVNVPVDAQPIGVARHGINAGWTVWAAAGSAAGIAAAEGTRRALRLIGGGQAELSTTPGDPCKNLPDHQMVFGWKVGGRKTFLDCGGWRNIMRGAVQGKDLLSHDGSPMQKIVDCIGKALRLVALTPTEFGVEYVWRWTHYIKGITVVRVDPYGRILNAASSRWTACAGA
jgi:hypothetical protein